MTCMHVPLFIIPCTLHVANLTACTTGGTKRVYENLACETIVTLGGYGCMLYVNLELQIRQNFRNRNLEGVDYSCIFKFRLGMYTTQ